MLYREIIAVCSHIHTKHINTLCGQNVELLSVQPAVHIVTTGLWRVENTARTQASSDSHKQSELFTSAQKGNKDILS